MSYEWIKENALRHVLMVNGKRVAVVSREHVSTRWSFRGARYMSLEGAKNNAESVLGINKQTA